MFRLKFSDFTIMVCAALNYISIIVALILTNKWYSLIKTNAIQ